VTNKDLLLAKLCAIAYADDALSQYQRLGCRAAALHQPWSSDEAYILSKGLQVCVVARGSNNWEDWARRNFFALPRAVPDLEFKAHWGMWEAAVSVLRSIEAAIVISQPEQIFFTGHSKGGAMALLWAIALRQYKPQVVTFGMPRVLTDGGARVWHRRVIHVRDPVGRLPPRSAGWRHQGLPIVIGDDGAVLSTKALEAEMLKPFDLRSLPDRVGCHFAYGSDIKALWEAR
jgi:hypothetical protein